MKLKALLSSLLLAGIIFLNADRSSAETFREGSNVISGGLGFGSALAGSLSYGSQSPGLALSFEHGMWEVGGPGAISLGGYLGYKSYKYSVSGVSGGVIYNYTQKWSYTIIGLRSAYHYNGFTDEKFDPYGGLMLSYDIFGHSISGDNSGVVNIKGNSEVFLSAFFGARYYFADNLAVYGEIGYGVAFFTVGLSYNIQ